MSDGADERGPSGPLGEDEVELAVEAVQGAAALGRVIDAGERAAALRGRRVLVGAIDPCGECDVCRSGGAAVCPLLRRRTTPIGARLRAAGRWVVALDDGLDVPAPAGAAVAGDVALAYTLYARTGLAPRDPAVIVGGSAVARFLVEILRAKGLTPTVVADPAATAWCDWLLARGAVVVRVAPGASDAEARDAVTAAIAAQGTGARPWRVLAATPDAVPRAAALAGPRGTLTVLAPSPPLPGELIAREVTTIGVAGAHPDLIVEAAAMCVKGEIDLAAGTIAAPAGAPAEGHDDAMRAIVAPR